MKKLEEILSAHCYDEFVEKVRYYVGEESFQVIFPAVKKAVEEGSGKAREEILIEWLGMDSCRVCSECGAIMDKGWYMNCAGYACSDECAAAIEGITMDQFKKWRIYKDDIIYYLGEEELGRDIEELTQEECDKIIDENCQDCDYYYTEWY